MAENTKDETKDETEFERPFDTRFDRSGRGFPNFAYRLRQIERRLGALERRLDNPGAHAPSTPKEKDDGRTRG